MAQTISENELVIFLDAKPQESIDTSKDIMLCFTAVTAGFDNYWAMVGYRDFRQMKCPLHISPKGTLDKALHQLTLKNNSIGMFLDLSKARTLNWLTQPIPMRFANHVNIEYGFWTRYSIPYQFDGIFFIDKTTSAKPLTKNN